MDTETSAPERKSPFKRILFFIRILEIRLRFLAILVVTALLVGYWDHVENYIERWQRSRESARSGGADATAIKTGGESDVEYFCGMHPFVIRDRQSKCPICGMDLTKRKKGAPMQLPEGTLARVQISPERIAHAGVQIEPVAYRLLTRTVQSFGVLEPDESRLTRITARFPGRIEDLMVNTTGQVIKKDAPLARLYSPKFLQGAQEYLQALGSQRRIEALPDPGADQKTRAAQVTSVARQRLRLAGYSEQQLEELGRITATSYIEHITLHSPISGIVQEKYVLLGDSVEETTPMYLIADLSVLWAQIQILESDIPAVKTGMAVEISAVAQPDLILHGTVDFIYQTMDPFSRSLKARVVIPNAGGELKPGMYITATLRAPVGRYQNLADAATSMSAPKAADAGSTAPAQHAGHSGASPAMAMAMADASTAVKLPTSTQDDARRYVDSLAPGTEYFVCPMDPEVVSNKATDACALCGMKINKKMTKEEKKRPAAGGDSSIAATDAPSEEQWAEGYACPMHPCHLSNKPGLCGHRNCGMKMAKCRIERMLSVPETAVIDTGKRQVVYVESAPGMFEARLVRLGMRSGQYYPVLEGLKPGQRVATYGSFLIDAEARLNPSEAGHAPM